MASSVPRELGGAGRIVGEQAFDAERHVGQPPGRIEPRAEGEAEVDRRWPGAGRAPAAANSAAMPGCIRPARIRFRPWATRRRLLRVEPDDIGDGAERDQVEQRIEPRLVGRRELAALAQLGAQRQQHVESDADAGQLLAREAAAGLARIDDHVGVGQRHPRRRRPPAGGGR